MASLIYRSLFWYRIAMNVLYSGSYKARMLQVTPLIKGKSCLELCFGDTLLAAYCMKQNIVWTGYDVNPNFVQHATKGGFDAHVQDINELESLPKNDVCIMAGSLYHFHQSALELIGKMTDAAPLVIICEPIKNLSSAKGIMGWLARRSSATATGPASFRYTRESFIQVMQSAALATGRQLRLEKEFKKDLTISLHL
jgi:hypothetical protein